MSTKNPTKQKRKPPYNQNQPNRQNQPQAQAQQQAKPKPSPVDQQALAAQEAARKEQRLQRQAQARADAAKRKRQENLRKYAIMGAVVLAVGTLITWLVVRELNKPGQAVDVMGDRTHLTNATDAHIPYSTDPPTSGPHTQAVPGFQVYTTPIAKEMQVHGLEDGGVIINYKPGTEQAVVDKLGEIARVYQATTDKNHVIVAPYDGLSNTIVLTSWGRIDRLDALDEARIRRFVDAYANVDHHGGQQ